MANEYFKSLTALAFALIKGVELEKYEKQHSIYYERCLDKLEQLQLNIKNLVLFIAGIKEKDFLENLSEDTPVQAFISNTFKHRHFAGLDSKNTPCVFMDGKTSFTTKQTTKAYSILIKENEELSKLQWFVNELKYLKKYKLEEYKNNKNLLVILFALAKLLDIDENVNYNMLEKYIRKIYACKPLTPIKKDEENWVKMNSAEEYFSERCLGLFADKNKKGYYIYAVKFRLPINIKNNIVYIYDENVITCGITSTQYIKYPFMPKTFVVDIVPVKDKKIYKPTENGYKIITEIIKYYEPFGVKFNNFNYTF